MSWVARTLATGLIAGAASTAVAAACSRRENRHAARPMNAVAHIYDGGAPSKRDGTGMRNTLLGFGIHAGAAVWWAAFFEGLFGRAAERSLGAGVAGGIAVSAVAYVVDYKVVASRFRPGFERFLSGPSMLAVYGSLAAAFAISARLRRLRHHEVEDPDERDERRDTEARPDRVVAPELSR